MNASLGLTFRRTVALAAGLAAFGLAAPAFAQSSADAPTPEQTYAAILKQIDDTRTNIARQELLIERQRARIDSLTTQLADAPGINDAYLPVITRFASEIEGVVEDDVPFRTGERFARIVDMQELIGNDEARLGEKLARALKVAEIEATYGYEVEAYDANHPTDPGRRYRACQENPEARACSLDDDMRASLENNTASIPQMELDLTDGSYVRYGRLSIAYVDLGTDEMLVFDPTAGEWREARGSEEAPLRRNLRIARGEAAPDVVEAPVVKTN